MVKSNKGLWGGGEFVNVMRSLKQMVEMLLQREDIDVNQARDDGMTPLAVAAYSGHATVAERLLRHPRIDVNKRDGICRTPRYWAESTDCELEMNENEANQVRIHSKQLNFIILCWMV